MAVLKFFTLIPIDVWVAVAGAICILLFWSGGQSHIFVAGYIVACIYVFARAFAKK